MRRPVGVGAAALLYCLAFGLGVRLEAQEAPLPELFKDQALAVHIGARIHESGAQAAAVESDSVRYTVPGNPVAVKLVGSNVVILIQVTPFAEGKSGLVLVAQGQVWVRRGEGELSYRTTLDSVSVGYGERVFFFPLGRDPAGNAPIRLEIFVERYAGAPAGAAGLAPAGQGSSPAATSAAESGKSKK
ncbi:MAG: hypothetical protein JNG85_17170 [Spirochaetaceae bacterium]|nr:hypothetical protein [Spirochaetaceae bacterium]